MAKNGFSVWVRPRPGRDGSGLPTLPGTPGPTVSPDPNGSRAQRRAAARLGMTPPPTGDNPKD